MQEPKQGEHPILNLAQDENEEDEDGSDVFPYIGENLMLHREMMIPKKEQKQSNNNEDSWLQTNFFRTRCTLGGKYVKLLLIVTVVRIWFPKRW